jgi:uncharacterized iron-regulated membrane protein
MSKLSKLGVQAHMGYLFGWLNQLLLAALALGLLCVIVWGYRMWRQRRPPAPTAPRSAPRRSGAPGGACTPAVLLVGLPVTVAVGWALPEFGVSLLAFLVIDAIAGTGQQRRRAATAPVSPAPAGT